eukprot:Polyplicarium_translucidae@DN3339_c1_g1_i2.p1
MEEPAQSPASPSESKPTVLVIIGMAGAGKSTFARSLHGHLSGGARRVYGVNLDPACLEVPFPCNIDIRDTVNYKTVMKKFQLGPNGAILTALNLFATRFDKVLDLIESRARETDFVLLDTPGQIEVFNWSASGSIILDALSLSFPTVVVYVIDTPRCERPITFMSNMLYACSVLYKTKLPFVVCFNKTDVRDHQDCVSWMKDYDKFCDAAMRDESYMASLSRSCGLAMMEFYKNLRTVGISSVTLAGFPDLMSAVQDARKEYFEEYCDWLKHNRDEIKAKNEETAAVHLEAFRSDVDMTVPRKS